MNSVCRGRLLQLPRLLHHHPEGKEENKAETRRIRVLKIRVRTHPNVLIFPCLWLESAEFFFWVTSEPRRAWRHWTSAILSPRDNDGGPAPGRTRKQSLLLCLGHLQAPGATMSPFVAMPHGSLRRRFLVSVCLKADIGIVECRNPSCWDLS
ncbi:hypothetical protein VTI74DRAFT_8088 [Chaetomium olivicolor]